MKFEFKRNSKYSIVRLTVNIAFAALLITLIPFSILSKDWRFLIIYILVFATWIYGSMKFGEDFNKRKPTRFEIVCVLLIQLILFILLFYMLFWNGHK